MLLLIIVLATIATLSVAGWFIHNDSGFVQIVFLNTTYELTLAQFSIGILVLLVAFFVLVHVVLLPSTLKNMGAKREMKNALKNIGTAEVSMVLGDYPKAEGLLMKDVPQGAEMTHFYAASKAAHKRGRFEQRDHYLQKAGSLADDKTQVGIELTHADMLLDSNENEAAVAILNKLVYKAPKLASASELLIKAYQKTENWQALKPHLLSTRRNKLFSDEQQAQYETALFSNLISQGDSEKALQALWHEAPTPVRNSDGCVVAYTQQLIKVGASEAAERLLVGRLSRECSPELAAAFSQLETKDPKTQLTYVENWLEKYPNQPSLLYKAGQLAVQQELWGKAKGFLESSVEHAPTPAAYALLGEVLDQSGEGEAAKAQYKKGLELLAAS